MKLFRCLMKPFWFIRQICRFLFFSIFSNLRHLFEPNSVVVGMPVNAVYLNWCMFFNYFMQSCHPKNIFIDSLHISHQFLSLLPYLCTYYVKLGIVAKGAFKGVRQITRPWVHSRRKRRKRKRKTMFILFVSSLPSSFSPTLPSFALDVLSSFLSPNSKGLFLSFTWKPAELCNFSLSGKRSFTSSRVVLCSSFSVSLIHILAICNFQT